MRHSPGRLVRYRQFALQKFGRDAALVAAHQVGGNNPLREIRPGPMQHRSSSDRFLPVAGGAFIAPRPRLQPPGLPPAAPGTDKPPGPAKACQVLNAPPLRPNPRRKPQKPSHPIPPLPIGAMLLSRETRHKNIQKTCSTWTGIIENAPKTWDAYYDFFKEVQKKLRMRNVYGMGFQLNTTGNDSNALFDYFLIAYGGKDVVTEDGKLHIHDPAIKEAAIKTVTYPTIAYKEGFVPPGAINWNDADDNNAFHAKQIVMDLDGTISTEVAVLSQGKKDDYDDIVTMGLALSNDGKPVPAQANSGTGLIPKGGKNVEVAKEFLKYFIQPKVNNEWLKTGLGRNIPCMPSVVKNDPWWFADPHREAYVNQGLLGPTLPALWAYNPAYAQVQN